MRTRAASGRPVAVRRLLLAGTALAAVLAGAGHAAAAGGGGTAQVVLRDIAFKHRVTRIHVGQRVTWTWNDHDVVHNIHSTGRPKFAGATDRRTGTHTVRFTRKGTYRYACTLHPGMVGTIVVG